MNNQKAVDRFMEKVTTQEDGCWIWQGACNSSGYGFFSDNGLNISAHRWSYIQFKSAVPEGLQIDHTCRVRMCVNPDHLEAVSREENIRRIALRSEVEPPENKTSSPRKPRRIVQDRPGRPALDTQNYTVRLFPEQADWLRTQGGLSVALRQLIDKEKEKETK